jgi:hypothetical protein
MAHLWIGLWIRFLNLADGRSVDERIGLESSIDNSLMIDRLSYPAEPLNAERYRKPN